MFTKTQYVEIFHLLFIFHLEKKLERNLYAMKGGCNLRFFFKSIRYSEDIDFDVQTIAKDTLMHKIDKIIESQPFDLNLKNKGLEMVQVSKPKQTETTQRWKILLKAQGLTLDIPTKIEFSRCSMQQQLIFEPIDPNIIKLYGLYPVLSNHYILQTTFNQKIEALINRSETQARDIFDLKLLLDQGAEPKKIYIMGNSLENTVDQALERVLTISFSDYKSQVVAYLMPEYQSYYGTEDAWNQIQEYVIHKLEQASNDLN